MIERLSLNHPARLGFPGSTRRWTPTASLAAIAALLVLASPWAGTIHAGAQAPAAAPGSTAPRAQTSGLADFSSPQFPTVIQHVILVMEENHDLQWTLQDTGTGSFCDYWNNYAHVGSSTDPTNPCASPVASYYATTHPSGPNYIAVTSGVKKSATIDGYSIPNIFASLDSEGRGWRAYMDAMPSSQPCDESSANAYVPGHNAPVYYTNIETTCASNDVTFSPNFANDLGTTTSCGLSPFSFIAPDNLDNAHSGSLSAASTWLTTNVVTPVKNSACWTSTVIFVTFDEAYLQSTGKPEKCTCYTQDGFTVTGGPVYMVAISPASPEANSITTVSSHFSLLSTILWLLAIPDTMKYSSATATADNFGPLKPLFGVPF
jgi:hypothetical protein